MKRVKCANCDKLFRFDGSSPVVVIDGVEHHTCPTCLAASRADFVRKLAAGDKRANEIWDIVNMAVRKGKVQ